MLSTPLHLLHEHNEEMAKLCFEKAGNTYNQELVTASNHYDCSNLLYAHSAAAVVEIVLMTTNSFTSILFCVIIVFYPVAALS